MVPNRKTRVMVVDDSMLARNVIMQGLGAHPQIEIVGYAINALDAKSKIPQLRPDVLTMDVEMPVLSGIDFLKQYLPQYPLPVVLVSALDLKVFDALDAGAVDFVRKPDAETGPDAFLGELTQKVLIAATARVQARPAADGGAVPPDAPAPLGPKPALDRMLIGLGASTGGTEATLEVLKRLPADIPGTVIVQHMPPGFTQMYAQRLNRLCPMEVREGKTGDELRRGLVLVAPADLQARVVRIGQRYLLSCTQGERVSGHRPSVDVLFHSMARVVTGGMVGILLTGMGQDGAEGLLAMKKQGAYTIGQDQASSVVYGMPMAAHKLGAVTVQAACGNIPGVLLSYFNSL